MKTEAQIQARILRYINEIRLYETFDNLTLAKNIERSNRIRELEWVLGYDVRLVIVEGPPNENIL